MQEHAPSVPGQVLARFGGKLPRRTSASGHWWSLRQGTIEVIRETPSPPREFALRITLEAARPLALASVIKTLFDGVICALHRHDGRDLEVIGGRLAARLEVDSSKVIDELCSSRGNILGTRRLIKPTKSGGLHWNPYDEGCLVGQVSYLPGNGTFSGELLTCAGAAQ